MKSIFSKLFVGFLIIFLTFAIITSILSYNSIKRYNIEIFKKDLTNLSSVLEGSVKNYIISKDTTQLRQFIEENGQKINIRLTIIGRDGKVLADSKANPDTMENHLNRPEIQQALLQEQNGSSERYSHTLQNDMLYVAIPIYNNTNEIIRFVRASYFLKDLNPLLQDLSKNLLTILIISIIFVLIGVYFIASNISKPISQLSTATKEVAKGEFSTQLTTRRKDEFGELVTDFNIMSKQIRELFDELNSQKNELHSIISAIPDGILVIRGNSILLTNNAFEKIFNYVPTFRDELQKIESFEILTKLLEKLKSVGIFYSEEIEINNTSYTVSLSKIQETDEIIFVFHNVSELKKFEKIKKDFIINVSHELKTPLTAIKGFIETLEEEITESEHLRYVQIVRRHTDRLIDIVQDLLLLSELEDKSAVDKLLITPVDFSILIEGITKLFEPKLKEKNLFLNVNISPDFPKINVDSYRFEQVMINLINNSIKYTEQGGIEINTYTNDDTVFIEVLDTGIGISPEDRDRIFERFYISDKSRSRKSGGSGIGLSIVKHIIMLHNGKISVDPTYTKGAKFVIELAR
ncbi:MAG TPA: ATP-binding protein [Bacteroidota bacterium]|nr:ATP-binding protein [Candidatus Kapabacteria bacterium]HRS01875.1 ATP-binding protein [Bacteroidota bacterium]